MKRFFVLAIGMLALIVGSNPLLAQERDRPTARERRAAERTATREAPQPQSWTGNQAGGFGGGNSGASGFVDPGANQFFRTGIPSVFPFYSLPTGFINQETPFSFSGRPSSFTAGVFYGYNVQVGNGVVGVEADFAWKKLETSAALGTTTSVTYVPFFPPSAQEFATRNEAFTGSIKQGWDASVRLRGGWLVTPWTLLYLTGGVAFGEISGSFSYRAVTNYAGEFVFTDTTTGAGSWNDTRIGATVGIGGETILVPGWKARFEYRYTDFGSFSKDVALVRTCTDATAGATCAAVGPNVGSTNAHIDLRAAFHTVRLGLGFNF